MIIALDLPDGAAVRDMLDRIGPGRWVYKIGLELLFHPDGAAVMRDIQHRGHLLFIDAKLHDIPRTVMAATAELVHEFRPRFLTVHAEPNCVAAARQAGGHELQILAVTVLTSLSQSDMAAQGWPGSIADLVAARARIALREGAHGIIASALELPTLPGLRAEIGRDFHRVTPGIRPTGFVHGDQQRVMTPNQAMRLGASHIVVGRPILQAADPRDTTLAILAEMEGGMGKHTARC